MTSTLTARLADHFHNPVPDGTAVSFTSEGGSVVASYTTAGGACTSVLTSQEPRPKNGRVTVLARATGEEAFVDSNGNGTADAGELVDVNGVSSDMPEAWVGYNENGVRNANEPYYDFNGNGNYDGSDGKYNGVLCTTPGTGICSRQKSIDVRGSQVIVFSTSTANITINGGATIALPPCDPVNGIVAGTFPATVVDVHGNAMPAGTKVAFASTNGTFVSPTSIVVPDTIGCRIGNDPAGVPYDCPASAGSATFGDILVTMKTDVTFTPPSAGSPPGTPDSCGGNLTPTGTFTVTVTSPKGLVTPNSPNSSADITD